MGNRQVESGGEREQSRFRKWFWTSAFEELKQKPGAQLMEKRWCEKTPHNRCEFTQHLKLS
jgi:uncharacterized protein YfaT (DUF1175 family)